MTETDTCDEMAILRRIPTNCHTTPARQWIVGDRDDDEIDPSDLELALLWADHNVALRSTLGDMKYCEHPGYHYTIDHHADLQVIESDSGDTVTTADARAELADDLADDAVTVEAILVDETAPEHLRNVGKRIVTDGGQPDLLGYCDRCDSIHRPSEPCKGAVADGGLVAGTETTNAFLRARLATAYRSEGKIRCDGCDGMVDLGESGVADAIAAWNDHVADCGGEANE